MSEDSDGGPPPGDTSKKRKLEENTVDFRMFTKTNYKRQFPENYSGDCVVYVESMNNEKLGNKNPITLTKLFTENVKGIVGVHRVNAYKVGVTFKKPAPANCFLKMDHFLIRNKLKAFVPAHQSEITGVIKYVPKDLSNEVIYKNITCDTEVISIKRFFKKVEGKLTPLGTIAVTFAGTILPQHAYIQMFRYPVHLYIPPLLQCFKCLKFNHSAKVCRGEQMCSSCAGRHSYKECDVEEIVCINCSGNHLAISRDCPVKQKKMQEKRKKYENFNRSYATVVSSVPLLTDPKSFPTISRPVNVPPVSNTKTTFNVEQIINNDIILNALVKSLVTLGNDNSNSPVTNKRIKDILLANLIN